MKIKKKYQTTQYTHNDYVEYCRKLWEVAELQQKLVPFSLGFSVEISNGMVSYDKDMIPTCGFMIGGDLPDLTAFLDSMAHELRTIVSEASRK